MINESAIEQINALLVDHGLDDAAVAELRNKWPDIHFTYCSNDDICGPSPFRESENFSIYLIDSRNHCLNFTTSTEVATGLVLAEHEDDIY